MLVFYFYTINSLKIHIICLHYTFKNVIIEKYIPQKEVYIVGKTKMVLQGDRRKKDISIIAKNVFVGDYSVRTMVLFPRGFFVDEITGQFNRLIKKLYFMEEYGDGFFPTVLLYEDCSGNFFKVENKEITQLFEYLSTCPNVYVTSNGIILFWSRSMLCGTLDMKEMYNFGDAVSNFVIKYAITDIYQQNNTDYVTATSYSNGASETFAISAPIDLCNDITLTLTKVQEQQ